MIKGYAAIVDPPRSTCRSPRSSRSHRWTPRRPTTSRTGCADIAELDACHSVAGEENYILKVRVRTPGDLEDLLARIRSAANVATRTTVVLSTPWE